MANNQLWLLQPACCCKLPLTQEVAAARTIAERGVVLVATAHGSCLSSLLRNPVLRPLLGDVTGVTLGDELARQTNSNVKVGWRLSAYVG